MKLGSILSSANLNKWQSKLDLSDWSFTIERIEPRQVTYDNDIPDTDRYFIGIEIQQENKIGIIYHDVDLYEEAIVHELLHVKHPDKDEDWINEKTEELLQ